MLELLEDQTIVIVLWLVPCVLLLLYFLFEVNYLFRSFIGLLKFKLCTKKCDIFDDVITTGICTTTDLDYMFHMNNTRYFRELDMARIEFYGRTGLFDMLWRNNHRVFQTAQTLRYRKPITFLMHFRIRSRLLYWDERNMYLEQRFESVRDGFVRAISMSKQTLKNPRKLNMDHMVAEIAGRPVSRPDPCPILQKWMDSLKGCSDELRKENGLDSPDISTEQISTNNYLYNFPPCLVIEKT